MSINTAFWSELCIALPLAKFFVALAAPEAVRWDVEASTCYFAVCTWQPPLGTLY